MRNYLAIMLLAGACCLVFSQEAKADVNSITEVSYYEPTNSIYAWAATMADYETLSYYDLSHWGEVLKDDTQLTMFWAGSYDGLDAYNEEFFPYDPDAYYKIDVYPQLVAKRQYPGGGGYEDYYNYNPWAYGDPVNYPYYFGFAGPGPDVQIWSNTISLGTVFSIFTQGATSGPPHHLKVITDEIVMDNSSNLCTLPRVKKLITYQVVDYNNRAAGRIPIDEEPLNYNLIDNCSNQQVNMSWCSDLAITPNGIFIDGLRTGCPNAGKPSDCGFDLVNKWRWCRRGGPYYYDTVRLAWLYYDVRRTYVKVDGEIDITDGTYKYP